MKLINCELHSAITFAEHNQTCYNLAVAVAQAKDEEFAKEKQELINKAAEWLKNNIHDYYTTCEFEQWFDQMFDDFKEAMK